MAPRNTHSDSTFIFSVARLQVEVRDAGTADQPGPISEVTLRFPGPAIFRTRSHLGILTTPGWSPVAWTAIFFAIGKWALGLYLGSGSAASAYGAASSLITLLLWVYYSSQILLFGAEFTQVYAGRGGRDIEPDEHAMRVETKEVRS